METFFDSFHENDHLSENTFMPLTDEVIKDQLGILESIKAEEKVTSCDPNMENQLLNGKEDFYQIMSDWQQHVGLLQSIDAEDLGLEFGLGLEGNGDALNSYSSGSLFEDKDSSILSKALKCPSQKNLVNFEPGPKFLTSAASKKELIIENLNPDNVQFENCQKLCKLIKTENNFVGKVTLLNGEKEILGKNIVGLHCLNEIKENPDENCQVTSTVINGKRYKIIIKPKSLKVKKLSEEKIKKTLIKKLLKCNLVAKAEPKEDEIISEMRNGNYDVPILDSDILPSWDLMNLDNGWNMQLENDNDNMAIEPEFKKNSPLRKKIAKLRKNKKKNSLSKSDEEVDVETISEKVVEGNNLSSLLKNFEDEMAKLQSEKSSDVTIREISEEKNEKQLNGTPEKIKNSLPREMLEKIEALKRKKDCRIPLIQAMPSKKTSKCCTRMQDAVATMNRNKLLKIVSNGDTVSLDHDYCSIFNKNNSIKSNKKSNYLIEKNPKRDSGMESGDVSDTSEGTNTPESTQNAQSTARNRLLQDQQRSEPSIASKAINAFHQPSHTASFQANTNSSDLIKTEIVSNGNKAITNNVTHTNSNSDNNNSSCSGNNVGIIHSEVRSGSDQSEKYNYKNNSNLLIDNNKSSDKGPLVENQERPKRKLKLEEYLSRRSIREKEKNEVINQAKSISSGCTQPDVSLSNSSKSNESGILKVNETKNFTDKNDEKNEKISEKTTDLVEKEKNYWLDRRQRSTSSEGKKESKRRSRSRSRSHWRGNSNSSNTTRREVRRRHRSRWSTSRDRKSDISSESSSRSQSRESSISSDYVSKKRSKHFSRYRRRSRSRSSSRGRSKSRNRNYSSRHHLNNYHYHRHSNKKRSRSPFYAYSMREKQRQIEERRVIYVGRIEEGMTSAKLRKRFSTFGPIIDISLHFREYGDNYGFVTYAYKADAYDAVEHGNDDPSLPHYDLCFGGRRGFCKEKYADLDGMPTSYSGFNDTPALRNNYDSFDLLLKEAQAKLKSRKKH